MRYLERERDGSDMEEKIVGAPAKVSKRERVGQIGVVEGTR